MFTIIATGLFGLLGTAVGGLISFLQQRSSAASDRLALAEGRVVEQQEKWREIRRTAALEFLLRVDQLNESGRELAGLTDAAPERYGAAEIAYEDAWRTLASEFAAFQLSVTAELNADAVKLYNAARAYSEAVDEVRELRRAEDTPDEKLDKAGAKVGRRQNALRDERRTFLAAAQHDLWADMVKAKETSDA